MKPAIFISLGILVYAVFIVWHGFRSFKSTSESSEKFFTADRGLNPFVLLCTTSISVFSALAFYGAPSGIYKDGIGFYSNTGGMVAGLLFVILGYRLWLLGKEYGFTTPVDYLRSRYYSDGFGLFISIVLVLFIVPYVAMQLIAIGDAVVVTTEGMVPYVVAVAVGTIVVSLHIIGGGMGSVAWMDTFHMVLGFGTLITLIVYLTMTYFPNGGFAEAVAIMQQNGTYDILSCPGPNGTFNWKGMLGNALTGAIATVVWPHIFMRTFVASSKENFRQMSWMMPISYVLVYSPIVIIGAILAPAILGKGFAQPDNIVAVLSTQYAPPFIAFISLLCLFAFGVSTADSLLLSASAMASRDIYLHHVYELKGRTSDPKQVVKFGRIVLLVLMVVTLVIVAIKPASITDYAYKLSSPFFAQILPATVFGLFWKKATKEGAIAGTVSGLIVAIIFTFFIAPPLGFSALIWALVVNTILLVAVSMFTTVPEEIVAKYHKRIDSIIYSGAELTSLTDATIASVNAKAADAR
ncbi:sodium:solute symporter family protein [Lactonifactor sp. BIOML-A3]|uniref:sodium:solute symporter family protein n=1 Tax=Lactonifactor TaxID=420345 RepID=UPI0012AEEB89|nr:MULTISPECIES: sodium:solute symporter family protein [Lactonifactor]MCB5711679.1 sodium:solute symporter family protein [Lactonifactor longoviformis]MCB5715646.1 sodium:solute symporter family protein [Lactonifactor longoviformis]MSA00681.1 sodium:solute symporter family protein [Lactonifactor sp. BIOML-A5]MSA06879.1 sodium:solute symporter family protein [Lactonifactor sp. BIOML-A4]MSA11518.1 sodium:solute symporter family protein [Lactonifactor sp. BIOML-A3]